MAKLWSSGRSGTKQRAPNAGNLLIFVLEQRSLSSFKPEKRNRIADSVLDVSKDGSAPSRLPTNRAKDPLRSGASRCESSMTTTGSRRLWSKPSQPRWREAGEIRGLGSAGKRCARFAPAPASGAGGICSTRYAVPPRFQPRPWSPISSKPSSRMATVSSSLMKPRRGWSMVVSTEITMLASSGRAASTPSYATG